MRSTATKARTTTLIGALFSVLVLLTACTSEESGAPGSAGGPAATADAPPVAKLSALPAADAADVSPVNPVTITVADGTIDKVALTNAEGKAVEGALSADKLTWTSAETLGYAKQYTYDASATGSDGKQVELKGSFTTLKPAKTPRATINPADNANVGVAMPISVKFPEGKVADKATVEKALTVKTSVAVEGSWAWLNDQQVDWRPKEYWPAGTKVPSTTPG